MALPGMDQIPTLNLHIKGLKHELNNALLSIYLPEFLSFVTTITFGAKMKKSLVQLALNNLKPKYRFWVST